MRVARQDKSRTATRGVQERDRNGNGNGSAFHGAARVSERAPVRTRERRAYPRAQMALSLSVRRVAGQICVSCARKVVFEHEGDFCDVCGAPAHGACLGEHRANAHAEAKAPFR